MSRAHRLPVALLTLALTAGGALMSSRGPHANPLPPRAPADSDARLQLLNEHEADALRYETLSVEHLARLRELLSREYTKRNRAINERHRKTCGLSNDDYRKRHTEGMALLEDFLVRYPDDAKWTPDVMFRLAELHTDEAGIKYDLAVGQRPCSDLEEAAAAEPAEGDGPSGPDYTKAIDLYREIVRRWPSYRQIDFVLYALAYYQGKQPSDDSIVQERNAARAELAHQALICFNKSVRTCRVYRGAPLTCSQTSWFSGVLVMEQDGAFRQCRVNTGDPTTCGMPLTGQAVALHDGRYRNCQFVDGKPMSCDGGASGSFPVSLDAIAEPPLDLDVCSSRQLARGALVDDYLAVDEAGDPVCLKQNPCSTNNPFAPLADIYAGCTPARAGSTLVDEVWLRVGESHFFGRCELPQAAAAYGRVAREDSEYFDAALYPLGWTYYRLNRYAKALEYFDRYVKLSDKLETETGEGFAFRDQAVKYLAISFSDAWPDPDPARSESSPNPASALRRIQPFYAARLTERHVRDVYEELGDTILSNSGRPASDNIMTSDMEFGFRKSVESWRVALTNWPIHKRNPIVHKKVVDALGTIVAAARKDEQTATETLATATTPAGRATAQEELTAAQAKVRSATDDEVGERQRIADLYREGGTWYASNVMDREAMAIARSLAEDSLKQAALEVNRKAKGEREAWEAPIRARLEQAVTLAAGGQAALRAMSGGEIAALKETVEEQFDSERMRLQDDPGRRAYQKTYLAAASMYQRFVETYPTSADVAQFTFNMAGCFFFADKFDDAIANYRWVRDARALVEPAVWEDAVRRVVESRRLAVAQQLARRRDCEQTLTSQGATAAIAGERCAGFLEQPADLTATSLKECPSAVANAITSVAETADGVEVTVRAPDDQGADDIRVRSRKLADRASTSDLQAQDPATTGKCPIVVAGTTVTVTDIEGGATLAVRPLDPTKLGLLRLVSRPLAIPQEVPPLYADLQGAYDEYAQFVPNNPAAAEFALKAAMIAYRHMHLDGPGGAVERFRKIVGPAEAGGFCKSEEAVQAKEGLLVVYASRGQNDLYFKTNEAFASAACGASEDDARVARQDNASREFNLAVDQLDEALTIKEAGNALLRQGMQTEAQEKFKASQERFLAAAQAFYTLYACQRREAGKCLPMSNDDPGKAYALYASATAYTEGGRPKTGIALYQVLLTEQRASTFYVESVFYVAKAHEASFDFKRAGDLYLEFFKIASGPSPNFRRRNMRGEPSYDQDKRSDPGFDLPTFKLDSLYNAALMRELDRDYRGAVDLYRQYASAPGSDQTRGSEAFLRIAGIYEKNGAYDDMVNAFAAWRRNYVPDPADGKVRLNWVRSFHLVSTGVGGKKAKDQAAAQRRTIDAFFEAYGRKPDGDADEENDEPGTVPTGAERLAREWAGEAQYRLSTRAAAGGIAKFKFKWAGKIIPDGRRVTPELARANYDASISALMATNATTLREYFKVLRFSSTWGLSAKVAIGDTSFLAGQKLVDTPLPDEVVRFAKENPDVDVEALFRERFECVASTDFWDPDDLERQKFCGCSNERFQGRGDTCEAELGVLTEQDRDGDKRVDYLDDDADGNGENDVAGALSRGEPKPRRKGYYPYGAKRFWSEVVADAKEVGIANEFTRHAEEQLNLLDPEKYPVQRAVITEPVLEP